KDPTWWQLQAAQTVIQRRDCVVSAGTGSGKTLPFVMPLFYDDGLVAVILSPLTALANEQAEQFREWNLRAVAINEDTLAE
ncbi:P-loop containing nucleoside triphosphate hydrolase protein, partial [Sistotremastrum suecicum HHB10207 ss-3]